MSAGVTIRDAVGYIRLAQMSEGLQEDAVGGARDAAARGEWRQAFERLTALEAEGPLRAEDVALLGRVAYAVGELDVAIEAWERAHALWVEAGEPVAAAGAALQVALHQLVEVTLMAPVRAWTAKAEGLLQDQEESSAHAWLAVVRAYERLLSGDFENARSWADRAVQIGMQQDPAACAIGRVAQARLLILAGDVQTGLALLDEVGVAAVAGGLDPIATGFVYCELVCALQGAAQYDAAEEWTEAMERWCTTSAVGSVHGRCRIHRAEILRLRGACAEAEREALAACEELRPYLRRELGWPLNELGRIRLHRGDVDAAEDAFLAAHRAGWDPQPGLALVQLARGEVETAVASIREALERPMRVPSKERPPDTALQRAPLLEAQVEIELAGGNVDRAGAAADELQLLADRFRSRALAATATLARARVRLAEKAVADAEQLFGEALRLWNEIGAPYEAAVARLDLARALRAGGRNQLADLEQRAAAAALDEIRGASGAAGDAQVVSLPEGDYWSLTFEGCTVRVRDLKGMRYLALLLSRPDRELHVLDLVAAESGATPEPENGRTEPSRRALGDAGELLDRRAKAAYRRRLAEIEQDIARARALGDADRARQAEGERDFLARELARAVGLGGRDRRAASSSERARVAVTRALRHAIGRVRESDPSLGEHLAAAICTGTYCVYAPSRAGRRVADERRPLRSSPGRPGR